MAQRLEVVGLSWPDFEDWFRGRWQPGQHVSVIAPTDAGKTTLVGHLLRLRRYVLAMDPKGGDDTMNALGWPRLERWPTDRQIERLLDRDDRADRPSRYLVGPSTYRVEDLARLKATLAACLDSVFDLGGWTVYVDELQVLADRRMMNLSGKAARLLIAARSRKVTFVSSFQAPSWVPSEAIRQPYWVFVSYTRDVDVVNRLAEVMGRSKAEMRGAIDELELHAWLLVGRNPREPLRVVRPPKLTRSPAEARSSS